ncbi:probable RNA polymerase II nuclear localization protein SLC7A6OS isoform X2 [Ischnura elegans]|uniref:probable RNA polymerase II nuclear localization protein SLC7A6OS isoform X2 n=1 Tax=Ischnura elegans TaxID=197161 RepID=UPI001ED88BE4|nr:probable RNA polymerase II nuclear localization protein SLC7A6OS isoform X2 [Ischnura elegans]
MDLIIRLKRPRNVDPYEALVLASKRRKKEDGSEENNVDSVGEPTILKFAGTLSHQDEDITPHISKARDHVNLKSLNRLESKDVINKVRSEARKASKESRLKVVNMSRAIPDVPVLVDHNYAGAGDGEKSGDSMQYTIVDVIHDADGGIDSESSQVEEDDRYVYSLYFANSAGGNVDDGFLDSLVSVEPLETNSVHLYDYRDNDDDINQDDDDDSNDEGNWRNDYPDSDPDNDGQDSEGSMEFMMENIKLGFVNYVYPNHFLLKNLFASLLKLIY